MNDASAVPMGGDASADELKVILDQKMAATKAADERVTALKAELAEAESTAKAAAAAEKLAKDKYTEAESLEGWTLHNNRRKRWRMMRE